MKKKTLICKQAGANFKIPLNEAEEFVKDSKPVDEQEIENGFDESEKAAAWSEFMYEQQLLDRENNY